jgi:hypothetical protein
MYTPSISPLSSPSDAIAEDEPEESSETGGDSQRGLRREKGRGEVSLSLSLQSFVPTSFYLLLYFVGTSLKLESSIVFKLEV